MNEITKEHRPAEAMDAFMKRQINYLTIAASFQRNKIYAETATDKQRKAVRDGLIIHLERISGECRLDTAAKTNHSARIEQLALDMCTDFPDTLFEGRFRIGTAQKALNLYLKYLWCMGWLNEPPPHCPFDAIVIGNLAGCDHIKWTEMNTMVEYEQLIDAAKEKARGGSLAFWELYLYNEE